jgi:hypothetical protein
MEKRNGVDRVFFSGKLGILRPPGSRQKTQTAYPSIPEPSDPTRNHSKAVPVEPGIPIQAASGGLLRIPAD